MRHSPTIYIHTVFLSYKKINSYKFYAHSFHEHWSSVCCRTDVLYVCINFTYVCIVYVHNIQAIYIEDLCLP
jgi:hypothetical protein